MEIILKPFSWLLMFFYNTFNSYGLALILFAVVIKLILFPVTLKGKKSMIQTTMLSGKMQQLQKQYGKDRERYNLEVQKLYEREKVNPMGGCLWSMIPLILLIALYAIIREPLTHFMSLSADQIALLADQLNWSTEAVAHGWVSQASMDKLLQQLANGEITTVFQNGAYNQVYLASLINDSNLATLQAALGEAGSNLFAMDFTFLGLNLASIPTWKFWAGGVTLGSIGLFILPLVSTGVSFLSMKVSMATNKINNQTRNDQMDKTNRVMLYTMPLMSLWIGFTVPAGLSVYWIAQYVVTMGQEVICAKLLKKDYEAARLAAQERERQEKEEEKKRKEEARLERQRRIEEEKKNKGKKKPAQKKNDEPEQEGVNKNDSREGIRAYARGRSYIPNRFGEVTPYTDPNEIFLAQLQAQAAAKGKKKGKTQEPEKEEPKAEEQVQAVQAAPGVEEPKALEEAPAGEETAQIPEEVREEDFAPAQEEVPQDEEETDEDKEGEGK